MYVQTPKVGTEQIFDCSQQFYGILTGTYVVVAEDDC